MRRWMLALLVVTMTVPAADARKVVGINGTAGEARYVADAVELGVTAMRVEQWMGRVPYYTRDGIRANLVENGIRELPIVNNYDVDWRSRRWDRACAAAVPYADLGIIEVANEPYGDWYRWPNRGHLRPGDYARMVARCARAVAKVDPKVRVLAAVTGDYRRSDGRWSQSDAGDGWIGDMYDAVPDLDRRIGGWAIHPYGSLSPRSDPNWSYGILGKLRPLMRGKPIWITEAGRQSDLRTGRGVSAQSAHVRRYLRDLRVDPQIEAMFLYGQKEWTPVGFSGGRFLDDNGWGLIDHLDRRKPAWYTFRREAARIPR